MAGDYLFVDLDLPSSQEIAVACDASGIEVATGVGYFVMWLVWVDKNTSSERLDGWKPSTVARLIGGPDEFWAALGRQGWLAFDDAGMTIPKYAERFSNTSRKRMLGNARVKKYRAKKEEDTTQQTAPPKEQCNAQALQKALHVTPETPKSALQSVNQETRVLDITPNEILTSLGVDTHPSEVKPPKVTKADAQPHAAEMFRRLRIRRPEPLFWTVGYAVASGVVPRTVPYECADAALGKTNQVAYFRTVYLAECQKLGLMQHQALPRLPPGFGSFDPPGNQGPSYVPEGTGYEPSHDEESR